MGDQPTLGAPLLPQSSAESEPTTPVGHLELEVEGSVGPWWHVKDPDRFFENVYNYYSSKGFKNIVSKGFLNHITVLVVLFLFLVVTVAINYDQLDKRVNHQPQCRADKVPLFAECNGTFPIRMSRLLEMSVTVYVILLLFLLIWGSSLWLFVKTIPGTLNVKEFYEKELKINHRRLQTIEWDVVLNLVVEAQKRLNIVQTDRDFTKLDITHLITRRQNYRTAIYSLGLLDDSLRVPYIGKKIFLSKSLTLAIDWVLDAHIFENHRIRQQVLSDNPRDIQAAERAMAKSLRFLGVMVFLLSPILIVARVAIFCFHHSDTLRKSQSGALSTRHWSPYARLRLRGYCEVDHIFYQRLSKGHKPATKYVALFSSEFSSIWAKFIGFTIGGFLVILVLLGMVFDEDFLFEELTPDRSVTWWIGILGVVLTLVQSMIPEENLVFDPAKDLRNVVYHTHYFPDHWEGKEDSLDVLDEFQTFFQFKGLTLLEEILGVLVVMPYTLFFKLPQSAERLLRFFRECTNQVEGIGHVCCFAELQDAGKETLQDMETSHSVLVNDRYPGSGQPQRSKMQWSMLCFKDHHSDWMPDTAGQAIIEESVAAIRAEYPDRHTEHSLHETFLPHSSKLPPIQENER